MRMGATIRPPAPQPIQMKALRQTTVVVLLLFACVLVIGAQSGRRQTKPPPTAPVPTPTPEPTPAKTQQKEPDIFFYVGADRNKSYSFYPYSYYDAVLSGCSEVLRRSSAKVDVTDRDLPRGEAIKKSKENAKTYTVLLQLTEETLGGTSGSQRYDQIELEYVVFAPLTGKIATSGRTYQNANRKGPIVIGPPGGGTTSGVYREVLLKQAGQDAGERILHALHLSVPRTN